MNYDDSMTKHDLDKLEVIEWARHTVDRNDLAFLSFSFNQPGHSNPNRNQDKENPVTISILSRHGSTLLFENIDGEDIVATQDAQIKLKKILSKIEGLIKSKYVVCYNLSYQKSVLEKISSHCGLEMPSFQGVCLMKNFAIYHGDYSSYWGNYKWQKLPDGCYEDPRINCEAIRKLLSDMTKPLYCAIETEIPFPPKQIVLKWRLFWDIHVRIQRIRPSYSNYFLHIPIRIPRFRVKTFKPSCHQKQD